MQEIIFKMNNTYKLTEKTNECTGCVFQELVKLNSSEIKDMRVLCESSEICFVMNGVWIKEDK